MKKLAIGCGIVLVLLGVTAAGVAYYVFRQVSSTMTQFAELGSVPDLERSVRNRDPFVPPASGELTDGQIEKLVQIQSAVRTRLGQRVKDLEAKYHTLVQKQEAAITDAPTILRAYADLASTWLDAKRSQIEALNAAGLSLDEYRWIRDQAYRAVGMAFVDLDLGRLVEDAKRGLTSGTPGQLRGAFESTGPEANKARVEKVRKHLEANIALASLGL